MYVLFVVLVFLVVYAAIALITRRAMSGAKFVWGAVLIALVALTIFNLASRAVGVDLGPFHAVSYNIPNDYLSRGFWGTLALVPYALACLAPALAHAIDLRR